MAVDIEYPLPGDTVGQEFHAGGEYDITRLTKKDKTPAASGLVDTYRVVCTLYQEGGTAAIQQKMTPDLTASAGFWDVTFTVSMNYENCVIKAELQKNETTVVSDQVEAIDVHVMAEGKITIDFIP